MSGIAPLANISDNLDLAAKFFRVMGKEGTSSEDLTRPVNDKRARQNLAAYLRAGCPKLPVEQVAPKAFAVWKSITVCGRTEDDLLAELKKNGFFVSDWAKDLMSKEAFTTLSDPMSINLARATVAELGFDEQPTTSEIWQRIKDLGHELCPAEVGPHLRLQFADQKRGDYCWTAMKQISDSLGRPRVFYVGRSVDGKSWLGASWASPDGRWGLDFSVVFVLCK